MEMKFGPRMLVINNKKPPKQQEVNTMKLESYEMKPIILATTKVQQFVANWYKKHSKKKPIKTQNQEEELQFIPPAPPCILRIKEEE